MPIGTAAAILGAGALSAGSGLFGASNAEKAAKAQAAAAKYAADLQQKQYEETRTDLAPYRSFGANANNPLANIYGFNGQAGYDQAAANFRADPGYNFALNQGINAAQGSAAAQGELNSGGTLKALQERGMGLADQQYNNYIGRLQQAQGVGLNASGMTGNFGANAAARAGQYATDAGAATAAGYVGSSNAITGGLQNGLGAYLYGSGLGVFGNNNTASKSGGAY